MFRIWVSISIVAYCLVTFPLILILYFCRRNFYPRSSMTDTLVWLESIFL